ncbi:glycosyltransferase family 4 protein [Gynuella sunshinyii]|uniref:Glycosyltransferase n=1 Tax=Gynuella sunshinyii YC6258 TaxID=1445510 RepID=A0A0C5VE40_9GAMM|nr:glycosyltransferase [Gynuella sunshinyii]AJQ92762.1 glycosyltransferase [Gynuella sunshinyii YC6258]
MTITLKAHPSLYSAFDVYPSAKGAATHIHQAAGTLFDRAGGGLLYTLGNEELPRYQREPGNIEILRFGGLVENYLHRALSFSAELSKILNNGLKDSLKIAQFRDPWSGVPVLRHGEGRFATIYEVNGLPSIELPAAFPNVSAATLHKLRKMEDECLDQATRIVVPSTIIRTHLIRRGVSGTRIEVIANGTRITPLQPRPAEAPARYVLYFGAVQDWQGLDVLLQAWRQLQDLPNLQLVICSSVKSRRAKAYQKLVQRLGLENHVQWHFQLSKEQLAPWISNAYLTVAPLTECPRNIEQGCCPLKILESMGAGVPVVASDLPVVHELIRHRENGYLIAPERPSELARALRVLLEYPDTVTQLGHAARQTIENGFLWSQANERLGRIHMELLKEK